MMANGQPDIGAMVKRLAGLSGESVLIDGGDLIIDGAKLAFDVPRPAPVPLFDDQLHDVLQYFQLKLAPEGPWTQRDGWLEVDGRAVARGSDAGLAFFHKDLRDGYLEADGQRTVGLLQVGDGVVSTRFEVLPESSAEVRLRWRLVEGGDTFECVLGDGLAQITRRPGLDSARDVLASVPFDLANNRAGALRFANIDDHLTVHLNGELLLVASYLGNQEFLGITAGQDLTSAPRVAFGCESGRVRFGGIRIARDLHYASGGQHAVNEPLQLGLDEVFLLGDNSRDSADGRYFGPVPLERLLGVPAAVTGPWDRARWLGLGRTPTGDGVVSRR